MVIIETKYASHLLFTHQFHLYPYLFSLLNLSLSWVFLLLLSVTISNKLVIAIYYLVCIIKLKKLINIDLLACYCCCTYFIFVVFCFYYTLLIAFKSKSTTSFFNSIYTIYKFNIKEIINIERLAYYCCYLYFVFIFY